MLMYANSITQWQANRADIKTNKNSLMGSSFTTLIISVTVYWKAGSVVERVIDCIEFPDGEACTHVDCSWVTLPIVTRRQWWGSSTTSGWVRSTSAPEGPLNILHSWMLTLWSTTLRVKKSLTELRLMRGVARSSSSCYPKIESPWAATWSRCCPSRQPSMKVTCEYKKNT